LGGCEDWGGALRRAQWLADATGAATSDASRFWNAEGAKLLAPLLHGAARTAGSMRDVLGWLDSGQLHDCHAALEDVGASAGAEQLMGVMQLDDRNRGTTVMSAANLLDAYRHPEVQRRDRAEIRPEELLNGKANTLYVVASEDDQRLLAPLVVSMLSEIVTYAQRRARLTGAPLDPPLRVLIDETANIAPVGQLPQYLSGALGAGVRFVTVWQDLSQLRVRYRDADGSVLSNSQVKVFMGPVTDERTRRYISGLLGEAQVDQTSRTAHEDGARRSSSTSQIWRPRASARDLQQLRGDRALVVHSHLPAAVLRTRAWFEDRELLARADAPKLPPQAGAALAQTQKGSGASASAGSILTTDGKGEEHGPWRP